VIPAIHPGVLAHMPEHIRTNNDPNIYFEMRTRLNAAASGEMDEDHPNAQAIALMGLQVINLLLEKNRAYGDSALAPLEVFSKGLTVQQRLGIRMDDKLARLARGADAGEDPALDLAGYLILHLIAGSEMKEYHP